MSDGSARDAVALVHEQWLDDVLDWPNDRNSYGISRTLVSTTWEWVYLYVHGANGLLVRAMC